MIYGSIQEVHTVPMTGRNYNFPDASLAGCSQELPHHLRGILPIESLIASHYRERRALIGGA